MGSLKFLAIKLLGDAYFKLAVFYRRTSSPDMDKVDHYLEKAKDRYLELSMWSELSIFSRNLVEVRLAALSNDYVMLSSIVEKGGLSIEVLAEAWGFIGLLASVDSTKADYAIESLYYAINLFEQRENLHDYLQPWLFILFDTNQITYLYIYNREYVDKVAIRQEINC